MFFLFDPLYFPNGYSEGRQAKLPVKILFLVLTHWNATTTRNNKLMSILYGEI